jgi:hypothetical protein
MLAAGFIMISVLFILIGVIALVIGLEKQETGKIWQAFLMMFIVALFLMLAFAFL